MCPGWAASWAASAAGPRGLGRDVASAECTDDLVRWCDRKLDESFSVAGGAVGACGTVTRMGAALLLPGAIADSEGLPASWQCTARCVRARPSGAPGPAGSGFVCAEAQASGPAARRSEHAKLAGRPGGDAALCLSAVRATRQQHALLREKLGTPRRAGGRWWGEGVQPLWARGAAGPAGRCACVPGRPWARVVAPRWPPLWSRCPGAAGPAWSPSACCAWAAAACGAALVQTI